MGKSKVMRCTSNVDGNRLDVWLDGEVVEADSEEKLCQLVKEVGRVCKRRKLHVNVGKSKVMRCTNREDGNRLNVTLDGEVLEEVDQFKYLGSVIVGPLVSPHRARSVPAADRVATGVGNPVPTSLDTTDVDSIGVWGCSPTSVGEERER